MLLNLQEIVLLGTLYITEVPCVNHAVYTKRRTLVGVRLLASPARFERAAFRLGGGRSIRLSYGDKSMQHQHAHLLCHEWGDLSSRGLLRFARSGGKSCRRKLHNALNFYKPQKDYGCRCKKVV